MSKTVAKYQQYAEYKDSGVEWLGEIPSHWDSKPLKYLCTYNDEVLTEATSSDTEIQYIDIGSVSATEGISHIETMLFKDTPSRARRIVKDGDVIVSTVRTYLEAIAPIDNPPENLIVSTGFAVIRPNKNLYKGYAAYCLRAKGFIKEVVARSVGVSYPAINSSDLVNIAVPSIAYSEQTKIANFLDHETAKIDSLIEKQQQLIQLLKEKRQAVISHAVTKGLNPDVAMKDSGVEWLGGVPEHWQTPCTKYLLEIPITDGPHETPQFVDEGIPFISAEAIHKGKINFDKKRGYIKPELNDIYSKKYSPKLEDIYMVKSGATTGKVAMVETEEKFNIWSPLAVFRCNKIKILPKFLLAVFNSNHFYDALVLNWSYGTQQNIGMGVLSNIEIPCPPINEQEAIIQHIDNELKVFKNLENKANHAIQLMQERRTALISSAVTGKIDVRNWQKPTEAKMEFSA